MTPGIADIQDNVTPRKGGVRYIVSAVILAFVLISLPILAIHAAPSPAGVAVTVQTASISGQVTDSAVDAPLTGGAIHGRVTSELTGEPLAGIHVGAEGIGQAPIQITYTDESGYYTLTELPAQSYTLYFNHYAENTAYAGEFYNNKTTFHSANPVAVTATMTTNIDVALTYIVDITGRVEYASNHNPVYTGVLAYDAAGKLVRTSGTDSTGRYIFNDLPSGAYRIRFGEYYSYVAPYYSNSVLFEDADWVTVTENIGVENIDASLVPRQETDLNIVTTSTRPNSILATRKGSFDPIYTLDGGQNWQDFPTTPVTTFSTPPQIALVPKDDPAHSLRYLVAPMDLSSPEEDGVYRSEDQGISWSRFEPTHDPRCDAGTADNVDTLATSLANPKAVYFISRCKKITFYPDGNEVGTYRTVYFSEDGGVNWQKGTMPTDDNGGGDGSVLRLLQPSPVEPKRIYMTYAVYQQGSTTWHRSNNNGQTWIAEPFTYAVIALDWTSAAKLYAVEDTATYPFFSDLFRYTGKRSTDGGVNWSDWPQQPCRTSFQQLISLPTAGGLLLLCDQGLYRSTNGGDSWELLTTQSTGSLAVHSGDHELVLWMRGSQLLGSRDQGKTWSNLVGGSALRLPSIRR